MACEDTLGKLFATILGRKQSAADGSYTAQLFAKGRSKIAQKLGEEAVETALAAVENKPAEVVKESADLLYHLLVLWAEMGLTPEQIMQELARREGTSGLEEKAKRPQ